MTKSQFVQRRLYKFYSFAWWVSQAKLTEKQRPELVKDLEMVGTKDARVTKKQLHYTEYTPVTNSQVEAEIFPDVPTWCSDKRTLMRILLYIQEVLGIDHSKIRAT